MKLGKNAKNRLKIKEKAEILAQENFQKRGNQLKRGTLTPLMKTDHVGSTCAHHYPHTKFYKNRSLHSYNRSGGLSFWLKTNLNTSIHTQQISYSISHLLGTVTT